MASSFIWNAVSQGIYPPKRSIISPSIQCWSQILGNNGEVGVRRRVSHHVPRPSTVYVVILQKTKRELRLSTNQTLMNKRRKKSESLIIFLFKWCGDEPDMLRSGHCSACSFKGYFPANYYNSTRRQVVEAPNVVLIWSSTLSFMLEGSRAFPIGPSVVCVF